MDNRFFERPILNSPYSCPARHWELDDQGQPTQQIIEKRRRAEFCRVAETHPRVRAYVKNHNLGLEVPYRYGSDTRRYITDFIVFVDDGNGEEDPLRLIVEIKGYRREDAKEKKATMEIYWAPGANNLKQYGRWAFAEFTEVYLYEVERCDIYIGLFGKEYGTKDEHGYSPTHREFDMAARLGKHRLIFIKGADDTGKATGMQALIREAGDQLVRRRFVTASELVAAVYGSLVQYLDEHELIRSAPFDASFCRNAAMDDLDSEKIHEFIRLARRARGFPLPEEASPMEVLTHLNLLDKERPTHAAILLFGRQPQRFLISSEVKCAHFHGMEVTKPIPFYRVYKGTVFDLVDQAVDFVLSKIDLAVGTRAQATQAPVAYEMPPEVIREAIVNAVAHRDYTSNGSVQVMLFADRLEVWNPGTLPPPLTLAKLRKPHGSVPFNPLLAEPLYLTKYIERMGTGTGDMIKLCRKFGLDEPKFAQTDGFVVTIRRKPDLAFKVVGGITGEVTGEVMRLLTVMSGEMKRTDIQAALALRHEDYFRESYLIPALTAGMIEMTIPDKPTTSKQRYRLTRKGLTVRDSGEVHRKQIVSAVAKSVIKGTSVKRSLRGVMESSGKTPGKTPGMILLILVERPTLAIPELAEEIGKSESAVERAIRKLRKEGRLKRIGPSKGGRWEVINKGEGQTQT